MIAGLDVFFRAMDIAEEAHLLLSTLDGGVWLPGTEAAISRTSTGAVSVAGGSAQRELALSWARAFSAVTFPGSSRRTVSSSAAASFCMPSTLSSVAAKLRWICA